MLQQWALLWQGPRRDNSVKDARIPNRPSKYQLLSLSCWASSNSKAPLPLSSWYRAESSRSVLWTNCWIAFTLAVWCCWKRLVFSQGWGEGERKQEEEEEGRVGRELFLFILLYKKREIVFVFPRGRKASPRRCAFGSPTCTLKSPSAVLKGISKARLHEC